MNEPPNEIYLQFYGDADPDSGGDVDASDVSWSQDRVFAGDVKYVRADVDEGDTEGDD